MTQTYQQSCRQNRPIRYRREHWCTCSIISFMCTFSMSLKCPLTVETPLKSTMSSVTELLHSCSCRVAWRLI